MLPPDSMEKEYEQIVRTPFAFRQVLILRVILSPPEIPPSLCSVLLRSSTSPTALRFCFAQNDTGGRSRNPKGEQQRCSDLAGIFESAL